MKIIPAVLLALKTMKTNEQCRIKINAEYAFMRNDYFAPKVPRDACNVQYTICMNSFVRRKECWEMNDEERLEQAKECKAKGNEFFKVHQCLLYRPKQLYYNYFVNYFWKNFKSYIT